MVNSGFETIGALSLAHDMVPDDVPARGGQLQAGQQYLVMVLDCRTGTSTSQHTSNSSCLSRQHQSARFTYVLHHSNIVHSKHFKLHHRL